MMTDKPSFVFYRSFYEAMEGLTDKQRLSIYEAISRYALDGDETELTGIAKNIFTLIKPQITANNKRYRNGCKGAEHGTKGGAPKGNSNAIKQPLNPSEKQPQTVESKQPQNNPKTTPNENENVNENENENVLKEINKEKAGKRTTFSPPSIDELSKFISENAYTVDCDSFYNFYQSKGWMVGTNKMKDWRAAVRTWNTKEKSSAKKESYAPNTRTAQRTHVPQGTGEYYTTLQIPISGKVG